MKKTEDKGITLVALIVTIIILLLLAGITISSLTGSGLFKKTQLTSEKYAEKSAREKLELELTNLVIEKQTNAEYNSNEYLTQKLEEKEFIINDDIVIVDGYQFQIDREVPKILVSLGKGSQNTDIKITVTQTVPTDYNSSIIKIEIEYDGDLSSIELAGENIELPEKVDGKYVIEKEVTSNGNYSIYVTNTNNEYSFSNVKVTGISEDMTIKTAEDLVAFRDRVNAGATYEGKTITIENDIDLSSICYKVDGTTENDISWIPIGTSTTPFKGIFNGNHNEIQNLYINSTNDYQGLFGYTKGATIKGIVIDENSSITGNNYVAGIVAFVNEGKLEECGNNGKIVGKERVGGVAANPVRAKIISCYNKANINADNLAGGILGICKGESSINKNNISYCYNTGDITGGFYVGGICGHTLDYGEITNCYNIGNIKATSSESTYNGMLGGITARLRAYGKIQYCYNLGTIEYTGTANYIGGICGDNAAYDASGDVVERASTISHCYNSSNVISKGKMSGGILGRNSQYCNIKNCYISNTTTVKYNSTTATSDIGTSSNYLGKIIGQAYSTSSTYVNNIGTLNTMPTVYNVVNGLSDIESQYWSNSDLNAPKLLWEK